VVSTADERDLIARARGGDADAYARLVGPHRAAAVRMAMSITRSAAEAEDAAQDALVKAHAALDRLDPDLTVRPWLLTIVANEARNRARSAGRREHLASRAAAAGADGASPPSDDLLVSAEEREDVLAALARLPHGDREVIGLRYLLELSEADTADALGVRRGTVKSRLSRAMSRLRTEMGIAAALLAVLIAVLAASPSARSQVLEWLGLKDDVRIERREPAVPPERRGAPPHLGRRVPLSALPWRPLYPRALGRPIAAYVDDSVPRRAISLTWPGLLLAEVQGRVGPLIGKAVGPGTRVERVRVGPYPAYWLAGEPHEFAYLDANGDARPATVRLARDTLLWERSDVLGDGVLLRLEGAPSKAAALRIARSTEP
jgi:RNA polymerase sigma factor (sigma-70 family)